MLPGDDYIYQCPACGNLVVRGSFGSGNTLRQFLYSDGRKVYPMLPEFPSLIQCVKCDAFMWLNLMEPIEKRRRGWENDTRKSAKYKNQDKPVRAEFLSINGNFKALATGFIKTREEVKFVRLHIWWGYNDRLIDYLPPFENKEDELRWRDNCEQLLQILIPANTTERLMIAEIYRGFGQFEECIKLVQSVEGGDEELKEKMVKECNDRSSRPFFIFK